MPVYEYECQECGLRFERMRKMSESDAPTPCTACKAPDARKRVSASNFAFSFPSSQMRGMAPPNTGTSIDHNADLVIGRDSEQRWKVAAERQTYKKKVLQKNPGATGFDLSKTHEGDYRVMRPEERKAAESARKLHRQAMAAVEATKKP